DDVLLRRVVGDDLDLRLGDGVDVVLGAAVDLGVPALAAVAGDLGDGEPADHVLAQRVRDGLDGVRLDDGGDELHRTSPAVAGWASGVPAGAGRAGAAVRRAPGAPTRS